MKNYIMKDGPFLKSKDTTKKMMLNLLIALLPIVFFNVYKNGIIPYQNNKISFIAIFYPLLFVLVPTITSCLVETLYGFIFLKKRKKDLLKFVVNSFSIFPGLFLGLILPINTPISIVILGAVVATVIGKLVYGGFGNNIFNPALIGRLFVISTYAVVISGAGGYLNSYEVDTIASSTPLSNANVVEGIGTYETLVSPYGNLLNFFIGTIPGAVGETSALLCLLAFIYLTITKTIKWKVPFTYVTTVFVMTYIIGSINNLGVWYPLFQILSGGLMFGAVFMATDPVTSPTTPVGQVLYGLFLGILTVEFRYLTPYPEGVLTSILTMNMFVFILDRIGATARFNLKKSIIPYICALALIAGLSIYIGNKFYKIENATDPDFTIESKNSEGEKTVYTAKQKGYSSDIKAEVTIENGEITSYKVLEQNDSFYSKIEDSNFINNLIRGQNDLEKVDTVSSATITSTALKKLLQNVIKDYQKAGNELTGNDSDFNIISSKEEDDKVIYEVEEKGFAGNIKMRITFRYDVIDTITVTEQDDSYFNLIIDNNYITKMIENQQVIEDLDTVSGATISSTALKKAIINTRKDYNLNYEK